MACGLTAVPPALAAESAGSAVMKVTAGHAVKGTKYTRTYGQVKGPLEIGFYHNKKRVGLMTGSYSMSEKLNARSNQWKRSLSLTIKNATGAAKGGVTTNIKVACGKGARSCKPSAAQTKRVSKGHTTRYSFSISSIGKHTNTHKPVLIITSTAPGYAPAMNEAPAMRTVRCDSDRSIRLKRGCVYPSIVPNFSISRSSPKWGAMAKHVYSAQRTLQGKPGYAKPLHRTTSAQARTNRKKTCPSSLTRPKGYECDEYPYASSKEGGSTIGKTQSRKMIPRSHNQDGGKQLQKFYDSNRILPGDAFYSIIK